MPTLPAEIWTQILVHVKHYRTLESCALVNRQFNSILSGKHFDDVLFRLPTTLDTVKATTTISTAIGERKIKLHPFLLSLHSYCHCDRAFHVDTLLIRQAYRSDATPFSESSFGPRSAVWPPTTDLIVSEMAHDWMGKNFVRLGRSAGVTVLDVMEAFAIVGMKAGGQILSCVKISEYGLKDGRLVLYGHYA